MGFPRLGFLNESWMFFLSPPLTLAGTASGRANWVHLPNSCPSGRILDTFELLPFWAATAAAVVFHFVRAVSLSNVLARAARGGKAALWGFRLIVGQTFGFQLDKYLGLRFLVVQTFVWHLASRKPKQPSSLLWGSLFLHLLLCHCHPFWRKLWYLSWWLSRVAGRKQGNWCEHWRNRSFYPSKLIHFHLWFPYSRTSRLLWSFYVDILHISCPRNPHIFGRCRLQNGWSQAWTDNCQSHLLLFRRRSCEGTRRGSSTSWWYLWRAKRSHTNLAEWEVCW